MRVHSRNYGMLTYQIIKLGDTLIDCSIEYLVVYIQKNALHNAR